MTKLATRAQVKKLEKLGYCFYTASMFSLKEAGDILRDHLPQVEKKSNLASRPELLDYVMVRSENLEPKYNDIDGVIFVP